MQSMPWLLRHSLRKGLNVSRTSLPRTSPLSSAPTAKALHLGDARRSFSICVRCQFRSQPTLLSDEIKKQTDTKTEDKPNGGNDPIHLPPPESFRDIETNAGDKPTPQPDTVHTQSKEPEHNATSDKTESGGLPSYIDERRSQFSKQFATLMDNLQSNVFVAGQRLNDLTGYSSIEALKRAIHEQEERLRAARLQVRTAKEAYAAAINRRSTSQREVNELLQRKHAWSPADLERFTHLYRNDHTNEVAENETQEALSAAERESEEAAAHLTKNILSRYHEEQVWSDKIRRMSTWGTWGLMGVNVLLFLIFQIAVEPWRRQRLVKGFEEKVMEAIEKEKVLAQTVPSTGTAASSHAPASTPVPRSSTNTMISEDEAAAAEAATNTFTDNDYSHLESTPTAPLVTHKTSPLETYKPSLQLPSSPTSVESWRQYVEELSSESPVVITRRDLSILAATSAAAGAAMTGLILTLTRLW
ncbi:Mdm33 family-domain-containing protein [Aspergillus unguis]